MKHDVAMGTGKPMYPAHQTLSVVEQGYTLPFAVAAFERRNDVSGGSTATSYGSGGHGVLSVLPGIVGSSSPAFGPAMGLSILNLLPALPSYKIDPATMFSYPFLDFYRIISVQRARKETTADYLKYVKQGYDFILFTHAGVPVAPGSMNFNGRFYLGLDTSSPAGVGYASYNGAFPMGWINKGSGTNPTLGTVDPDGGAMQINFAPLPESGTGVVPGAASVVTADIGHPGGFYTPARITAIAARYPFVNRWYAVYSTHHDGQIEIAVQHQGTVVYFAKPAGK
ncbi:MAG: hypothetical protein PHZ23_15820 [Acidiphilium sp.]|nr:hypothetical protein [Acidiphilium sp.]